MALYSVMRDMIQEGYQWQEDELLFTYMPILYEKYAYQWSLEI